MMKFKIYKRKNIINIKLKYKNLHRRILEKIGNPNLIGLDLNICWIFNLLFFFLYIFYFSSTEKIYFILQKFSGFFCDFLEFLYVLENTYNGGQRSLVKFQSMQIKGSWAKHVASIRQGSTRVDRVARADLQVESGRTRGPFSNWNDTISPGLYKACFFYFFSFFFVFLKLEIETLSFSL